MHIGELLTPRNRCEALPGQVLHRREHNHQRPRRVRRSVKGDHTDGHDGTACHHQIEKKLLHKVSVATYFCIYLHGL